MERFGHLIKQRMNALGLFNKVLKKLDRVHEEMHSEVEISHENIHAHEEAIKTAQAGIEENKEAIVFLEAEKAKTLETRNKITALISG